MFAVNLFLKLFNLSHKKIPIMNAIEQQSAKNLELITRMISETRTRFERGGGKIFLIWGIVTFSVSLLVYFLLSSTGNYSYNWLWFLIPVVGAPINAFYRRRVSTGVKSYIDSVIRYVWVVTGVVASVIPIVISFIDFRFPILMFEGTIVCSALIMTGLIIGSRVAAFAGVAGLVLSISLLFVGGLNSILIFAAMSVVSMIIPGVVIKGKSEIRESKN